MNRRMVEARYWDDERQIQADLYWSAADRAIVDGFNAARSNNILNANEHDIIRVIKAGDEDGLRRLLEAGRAGHWLGVGEGFSQQTPLMGCLYGPMRQGGNAKVWRVMHLMINHGADINQTLYGKSVLSCAVQCGNCQIMELLILHGANVNSLHSSSGNRGAPIDRTLLFSCQHKETAEILLRYGADVNATDVRGWTPLHHMIWKGYNFAELAPIPYLLIAHGANVEARTLDGQTLLHFASMHATGFLHVARDLLERGADVNATTFSCGKTPLHFAARYADTNFVRLLLSHGACTTTMDRDGRTPGQLCARQHSIGMQQTLDLLDEETRRRCEAVAMGLEQPNSILYKFPNELLRTLLQDGFEHDG